MHFAKTKIKKVNADWFYVSKVTVKMVTLFLLFTIVTVTHMTLILVVGCNVDHKVRLKTKPNLRKKSNSAILLLFSQTQVNL